ncbi:hypothetical protein NC651_040366 [Populus alba x Populus x berolinensis]|nr:hypothetical protein NC651_040366 [Populus alba x Populus x berolinensis]
MNMRTVRPLVAYSSLFLSVYSLPSAASLSFSSTCSPSLQLYLAVLWPYLDPTNVLRERGRWCCYLEVGWWALFADLLLGMGCVGSCFLVEYNTFSATSFGYKMSGFSSLAPKTKNLVVAGGLSAFVFGVYFYTMRAVGGTDELQTAIDKFEQQKSKEESEATIPSKA